MKKNGLIYLSGGGNWDKTVLLDTYFLKSLDKKDILFLPVAKITDEDGYVSCYEWLLSKLSKIDTNVNIKTELDFNKVKDLSEYSAIYIGGGNTYKLLKLINNSNFFEAITKYISEGGVVFGASAGAVIFGKDISTYVEENNTHDYPDSEGYCLLDNYSIVCHYLDGENSKAFDFIRRTKLPVIALPIGTALRCDESSVEPVGESSVYVFNANLERFEIKHKITLLELHMML